MILSDRRGRFSVGLDLLEDDPERVRQAMQGMIILRAEGRFDVARIDYSAEGPMFEPVAEGDRIPIYDKILHADGSIEWRKRDA